MHPTRRRLPFSLGALCLVASSGAAADHTKDSLETVKKNLTTKKAVLIDVREKREWDDGHLKDAAHAPLSELKTADGAKRLVARLPKDRIIYTHCAVGARALSAAKILGARGMNVRPLKAGYDELIEAGFKKAKPE